MRQELREYNLDWTYWSIMRLAAGTTDASTKEMQAMLDMTPTFKNVLSSLTRYEKPGKAFLKVASEYCHNLMTAHEKGKKIILNSFAFPPEICYAMDCIPIFPEMMTSLGTLLWQRGMSEFQDYCTEVGLTDTSCAAQRGGAGAFLSGCLSRPDMVIGNLGGICDTNSTVVSFISEYMNIPYYLLDYPPTLDDERAKKYHHEDFRNMIAFMEEHTGHPLDEDKLREICEETKKTDEYLIELNELKTLVPSPVPSSIEAFEFAGKYLMAGNGSCTELIKSMCELSRQRIGSDDVKEEKARGYFVYVSHFTHDMRFWNWMEDNGIAHLGEMLTWWYQKDEPYARPGSGYSIDMTNKDTMIDSLADQMAYYPMTKMIRGPYDAAGMWLEDTIRAIDTFKADFICYIGTMACRNSWGAAKLLARDVEEKLGIPGVIIYCDSWDERVMSWEAVRDRLEEFLTMRVFK